MLVQEEMGQYIGHKNIYVDVPSDYSRYAKTLPQAEKIYKLMVGEPKSHREWAESINKIGEINRIIRNNL